MSMIQLASVFVFAISSASYAQDDVLPQLTDGQGYVFVSQLSGECLQVKLDSETDPARTELETEVNTSLCPEQDIESSSSFWTIDSYSRTGKGIYLKNNQDLYLDISSRNPELVFQDYRSHEIKFYEQSAGYQIAFLHSSGELCLTLIDDQKLTSKPCQAGDQAQIWSAIPVE